jgi:hypothetical protein
MNRSALAAGAPARAAKVHPQNKEAVARRLPESRRNKPPCHPRPLFCHGRPFVALASGDWREQRPLHFMHHRGDLSP